MHDLVETARLLDILGNRNRRRIIELLRQKPCFVTEISDTLMLSPKAVIEHLQMMEREAILAYQTDDRRRKYYYLANDILVEVSLKHTPAGTGGGSGHVILAETRRAATEEEALAAARTEAGERNGRLIRSVAMLARMIRARDRLADNLEQLDHDIETKITDIARIHSDIFRDERELSVIIALCHESLTAEELGHITGSPADMLAPLIRRLERRGIVERNEGRVQLRGFHAE
jgi:ArsR family transcriptional regulator